ncbi:MAG TPA: Kdo hydroxylase family protein [Terriglobia bacterium]|nr:Kdo hydroxylase family protein [Terriglobia bacterium]
MTKLVQVDSPEGAPVTRGAEDPGSRYSEQLEQGNILFFSTTPFEFPEEDRRFLLGQRQSGASYHKNVAYRPKQGRLTGFVSRSRDEQDRLRIIMKTYSARVTQFGARLLPSYASNWKLDFASFRPQEEQGRQIRVRARNDLLHVDSFPTRPTHGDRILRIFTNINPTQPRVWLTTETFDGLAERFLGPDGPPGLRTGLETGGLRGGLVRAARALHLPVADPSPYDKFMLRFHHFLKENHEFQETCPKARWEFPPNSTWMVFTDMVAHAVLSGQFALEQTLIVPRDALVLPEKAPVSILESRIGRPMAG